MESLERNRVLCRKGAHELTMNEVEYVYSAAGYGTRFCTLAASNLRTNTNTSIGDGDGCTDTDSDNS